MPPPPPNRRRRDQITTCADIRSCSLCAAAVAGHALLEVVRVLSATPKSAAWRKKEGQQSQRVVLSLLALVLFCIGCCSATLPFSPLAVESTESLSIARGAMFGDGGLATSETPLEVQQRSPSPVVVTSHSSIPACSAPPLSKSAFNALRLCLSLASPLLPLPPSKVALPFSRRFRPLSLDRPELPRQRIVSYPMSSPFCASEERFERTPWRGAFSAVGDRMVVSLSLGDD